MHLIFYKTNDVFTAEEKIIENNIRVEIVPTPVQDKAYCGVCVKICNDDMDAVSVILSDLEYKTIEWGVCIELWTTSNFTKL